MSGSDFAGAAMAVACFNLLWWCQSLARRLSHVERTTDPPTGPGSGHWLETERWPAALRSGQPMGLAATPPLNSNQAQQVQRLLAETARP